MPTIPTPFVGGAESPERDRTDQTDLEPPFFNEEPAEATQEPKPGAATPQAAESEAEPPFFFEPDAPDQEAPPPQQAVSGQEPVPIDEVTFAPEPEPAFLAPQADEAPPEAPAAPQESADEELPDYLFGPDTPPPLSSSQEAAATPPLPESPELLAHKAEELLEGAQGDRIRDLVASLGSAASEVAIPRAFAAGYLAAKRGEEE